MVGLFGVLTYFVIGTIVAALDGRGKESWQLTAIAMAGAIVGAYVGQRLGVFGAFGELPGFICSAAGAVVFVRIYHARSVGVTVRDAASERSSEPAFPSTASATTDSSPSLLSLVAQSFGWGTICALASAAAGFMGHSIGSGLYPQPYEQIPSDFLFVPLGMILGFVAAGVARIARRDWGAFGMPFVVTLVAIAYAAMMFEYSRAHALPASVTATLEPAIVVPKTCSLGGCTLTDPPSQWYVTGQVRMKTSHLGATIDRIEITSDTYVRGPITPHPYTKEGAAEGARWRGPLVVLSGRQIPGPRRLVANTENTYTIVYPYHTKDGTSRRTISISAYLTDAAGHSAYAYATWNVE